MLSVEKTTSMILPYRLRMIVIMKREKYHIGDKTLVMTESNGVMIFEWVDNNNINNKNH